MRVVINLKHVSLRCILILRNLFQLRGSGQIDSTHILIVHYSVQMLLFHLKIWIQIEETFQIYKPKKFVLESPRVLVVTGVATT